MLSRKSIDSAIDALDYQRNELKYDQETYAPYSDAEFKSVLADLDAAIDDLVNAIGKL